MSKFDDFNLILTDFNKVEERVFLRNIAEFAAANQEVATKTFTLLLRNEKLNTQLKYLVFKSIAQLKLTEMISTVKDALYKEDKMPLIIEAVNCLLAMGSLPAFKVAVDYIVKHEGAEYYETLERNVLTVFGKNQLFYHFDLFYRNRGNVKEIEKSSEFLIEYLPEEHIKDLLPSLTSRIYKIRFELLRILKHRPNPIYYTYLYNYFKDNYNDADEDMFLMLCEALVVCASASGTKDRIFKQLKDHAQELNGDKKILFCITLLKLRTRELLRFIESVYPNLNFDRKLLVLNNFIPDEFINYAEFVRRLLKEETNGALLERIVKILTEANDFAFLFETLDSEETLRKGKILKMILDQVDRNPKEIDDYIRKYVAPEQDNEILHMALEYLLKYTADFDFKLIESIFFSVVPSRIKVLIISNVTKFDAFHQRHFMEAIFKNLSVVSSFKKDFLFSLLEVLNEKHFDEDLEERILNRVLVMMEEANREEIVDFIYFFDRYEINNERDRGLIIDELQMMRKTLLNSKEESNLVHMVDVLIEGIEKKTVLKK
jgi:hypothetical protein